MRVRQRIDGHRTEFADVKSSATVLMNDGQKNVACPTQPSNGSICLKQNQDSVSFDTKQIFAHFQ